MKSNRRTFLKTAGLLTAGAAFLDPARLFAARTESPRKNRSRSFRLEWENFEGIMKFTFTISGSSRKTTPIVITRLTWDGYTGYGEAALPPYLGETQASVNEFLKKVSEQVLPRFNDPFRIEEILAETDRIAIHNTAAKAAVDLALHDLAGQILGQPWWRIWGFSPDTCPNTSYTIGYDASDDIVNTKIDEAAWSKVLKVKLGMSEKEDKRMIDLIRAKTDTVICVDANQGWKDKHYALDMIHWLNERNVNMVEQPMPKGWLDESAWLTERSPLPVIADEACQRLSDVSRLHGAYTGINIKLMKCTGMREAREMVTLARSLNMKLMIGCMTETSVAISAAAQLAPVMQWADLDGNILLANDCFDGMKLKDGRITLSDKPGLGVTPRTK